MNITVKYDKQSVDIEGASESLHELSRALQDFAGSEVIALQLPPTSPAPYLGYAKSLKIERIQGNVCVSRIADEIIITGSPEKLLLLAHNVEHLAKQQGKTGSRHDKEHLHIEYHPGHFYLKEESLPLVVTKRQ